MELTTCKWKWIEAFGFYKTLCENEFIFDDNNKIFEEFKYCPFCSQKICEESKIYHPTIYLIEVSGIWQKTTKEFFDTMSENGLRKAKIDADYYEEAIELLSSSLELDEAIREVESWN